MNEIMESPAAIASRFINSTDRHVFLTGKAGTGKTTFLKSIIEETHKKALIVAPTGIAAINAGGVTIHSLFQLPFAAFLPERGAAGNNPRFNDPSTMLKHMQMHGRKRKLIQELELLIIDEVSMLRADILDAMDTVLRHVRKQRNVSFGGVQVLFIGDLLQLPPVVKDDDWQVLKEYYSSIFFFDARVLRNDKPFYIELDKIYRQSDTTFINLLNNLRTARVTSEDINLLNQYYKPNFRAALNENYIHLTTHNASADAINKDSLRLLKGKSYFFKAAIEQDFSENLYPLEYTLELKMDAQVMFIKNDLSGEHRYFNGKIGKVTKLESDVIEVTFDDGSPAVIVDRYTWENKKYDLNPVTNQIEEKIVGTFSHYPIRLAWAITVHKSQGLTFTKAIVDIGQAFAPGQVYVALSRLKSLEGLVLTSQINPSSLRQDSSVIGFAEVKEQQEAPDVVLKRESSNFLQKFLVNCFDFSRLFEQITEHADSYTKDEDRSIKQKYKKWADKLQEDTKELKEVADKFRPQLLSLTFHGEYEKLKDRLGKASGYFIPLLKEKSKAVLKLTEEIKEVSKVKTFLSELLEIEALFFRQIQLINKSEALLKSVMENTELKKDKKAIKAEEQERKSELNETFSKKTTKKSTVQVKGKIKKGKVQKGESQKESYRLYRTGLSIAEIAAERGMSPTTIEGHLTHYVTEGEIQISTLVSKEKVDKILEAYKSLETPTYSAMKEKLGEDYSYRDIKFVIASQIVS